MGAKLEVDCNAKRIRITQYFVVEDHTLPGGPPQGFTLMEIHDLMNAYDLAFNGPVLGGYRFRYCDCEVRFALELRMPPARPGDSVLRKGPPMPAGGGVALGPKAGGPDHTITVSPKPDGSFDWATGIDELGHDLGIPDPLGGTWYWRGNGGAGRVLERHVADIFANGRDNRDHYPPGHALQGWKQKAACCCTGQPKVTRLSDEEILREQLGASKKKKKKKKGRMGKGAARKRR
jgi:hypothetical protein